MSNIKEFHHDHIVAGQARQAKCCPTCGNQPEADKTFCSLDCDVQDYPDRLASTLPPTVTLYLSHDEDGLSAMLCHNFLQLKHSLAIANHSPSGFEYGYNGSGPAQLALAICMELFPRRLAVQLYQRFKFDVVAHIPRSESQEVVIDVHQFIQNNAEVLRTWRRESLEDCNFAEP